MKENEYLSDAELMQLIQEVEQGDMIPAPFYLKQEILHKVRKEEARQAARSAKIQFITYSCKVALATAAAIAVLLLAPSQFRNTTGNLDREPVRTEKISKKIEAKSYFVSESLMKFTNKVIGKEE